MPIFNNVILKSITYCIKRFFKLAFLFNLLLFIYLMQSIYFYSNKSLDISSDAAIVLGAAVWKNAPSPVFRERINHAINLYNDGKVKILIFTGGLGKGEKFTESEVAMHYAINKGVPKHSIFYETVSKITFENLKQAKKIMHQQQINSVLIVSDPLHMRRALTMANDLGLTAYSSPTPTSRYKTWKTKLEMLFRETYYYFGYFLRPLLNIA